MSPINPLLKFISRIFLPLITSAKSNALFTWPTILRMSVFVVNCPNLAAK